jgi:hypothetical protein
MKEAHAPRILKPGTLYDMGPVILKAWCDLAAVVAEETAHTWLYLVWGIEPQKRKR